MARQLAASTLKKLERKLQDERDRLEKIISVHEHDRELAMLAEGSADRSPDPDNVDGERSPSIWRPIGPWWRTPVLSSMRSSTLKAAWRRASTVYAK